MRKKETIPKKWLQKTFRIRAEAINLYKYLEYYSTTHDISKDVLFNKIVIYSLNYIRKEKPNIYVKGITERRLVKGFTMTQETLDKLKENIKNEKMKKGEYIEILIAIYAIKKLPKKDLKDFDMYINME